MPAKLTLRNGEHSTDYTLGASNTVGRHPDNTIQLLDQIVSKEHARISACGQGGYVLRDSGSLNGTYVNGRRVEEHDLRSGDQISMGETTLLFTELGPSTEASPLSRVTMMPGQVQSEIRRRVASSSQFLPAAEIDDLDLLRADYEKLRAAHELAQRLALHADLDVVLQRIVNETMRLIPADRAVILLCTPEDDTLVPSFVRQKREEEINLSTSILDEVRTKKRAVLSSDALVDARFKAARSVIMQGIRSTMCVPLLVRDEFLGAFHIDSVLTTGAFTEKDLLLFSGIASQAAIAIQNQRLAKKIESEAATRAQFQRLLSPQLVDQLVAGELTLDRGGSLREVTMLFADIRGFTALSERNPPGVMVETLNAYFEVMVDVLFDHGGTLDKYVGDEIIGLFGAPVAIDQAPLRAIRCALDMLRALTDFNRQRLQAGLEAIEIGIGINSGSVIAGAIGSRRTLQYTVVGDAVNVASRLCSVAAAGEIIVSDSTLRSCRDQVAVEQRHPVTVKGKAQSLRIFRAVGLREPASVIHDCTKGAQ
ncbi:MAG: adenylate/guanylate cyclase domain-containing protein [Nannocystaceae bacterium]